MPMPTIDAITAEIDAWFAEQMQCPPISYSVEAYNQAYVAKGVLRGRLIALFADESETAVTKPDRGTTKA